MSANHPRPNIRKAMLQRHESDTDKWTDAEIAVFRAMMYSLGRFKLSAETKKQEIFGVLSDLFIELSNRGPKPPASAAMKMKETLERKWGMGILMSLVDKKRHSDEITKDLEPMILMLNEGEFQDD